MKIIGGTQLYTIDERFARLSPYLNTLLDTEVGCDMKDDAYVIDNFPLLGKYLDYIQGKEFTLDATEKDEFLDMYDYFGHDANKYQMYETDMIPMKMHDNWVRDNLYMLELWRDPLYDLVEVPALEERVQKILSEIHLVENSYIAGGAAMYMAGWTDSYNDIDIFFTDKNALTDLLLQRSKHVIECLKASGDWTNMLVYGVTKNAVHICEAQGILRLYKAPTEIVHGFDVDCCGILYDLHTGKLWATKRAYWSFLNKMNIFDPERASPSYVSRLVKYMRRGYDIYIPYFSQLEINEQSVQDWKDTVLNMYYNNIESYIILLDENDKGALTLPDKYLEEVRIRGRDNYVPLPEEYYFLFSEDEKDRIFIEERMLKSMKKMDLSYPWGQIVKFIGDYYTTSVKESDQDILFLAKTLRVYTNRLNTNISDYDPEFVEMFRRFTSEEVEDTTPLLKEVMTEIIYRNGTLIMPDLEWKEQNPMEQISSTFNPTPITDIKEWLRESQFFL